MNKTFQHLDIEELNKKGLKKAFITEKILKYGVYLNLIPSFFYNILFIAFIRKNTQSATANDLLECQELYSWAKTVLMWTSFYLIQSILFCCCLKCNNHEDTNESNDCRMICLFLKSIFSYIPAIIFNNKIGALVEKVYSNESCKVMESLLQNFKLFEYYYVVSFTTFLCSIPCLAILMALKELYKSL